MKSLTATIVLLVLTLSGIAVNFIYINNVANRMESAVDSLPEPGDPACLDAAEEIRDLWESNTRFVGLSVGYAVLDRVSEQSAALCAAARSGDAFSYSIYRDLLRDALSDLRRLERFSFENIL